MFCPQCATPNADDSKFCRSCGIELGAVALVLKGEPVKASKKKSGKKKDEPATTEEWLERRAEGVSGVTRGSILMLVSLLIGAALALFVPAEVPWMLVWMVFFGWMAVWGGSEVAEGAGVIVEAKSRLRLLASKSGGESLASTPRELSPAREPLPTMSAAEAFRPQAPSSVTEGTTRELDELLESRGRARRPPTPPDG
ncbi:MAG TPA: zinc ribbon domain-containing protein [Pyrinomonadaceae bacterium]|nr:zinc ribbon domain-containing protein [Pyrinomonadaceae bacterium]